MYLGEDIRNIYILLLLSLSYSATLLVPDEYSTIQSAIDAASDGDEVLVDDGFYPENLVIEKDLILRSENGADVTTIDGGSPDDGEYGSAIVVRPESNTTHHPIVEISGFTIQNGTGTIMGREIETSDGPEIVNVKVGGGLYAYVSTPKVINNKFKNNGDEDTDEGGAIEASDEPEDQPFPTRDYVNHPDLQPATGDLDFSQNTFQGNDADYGSSVYIKGFNNDITGLTYGLFDEYDCSNQEAPPYWVNSLESEVDASDGDGFHCINSDQTDYYVAVDGDDNYNGTTADSSFQTIEKALSVINPNEINIVTIHLSEGTFSPDSTGEDFPVIMISNVNLSGEGEEVSILDAQNTAIVILLENCINNIINNITVTGGMGGGIYINHSNLLLQEMIISYNAGEYGGGISLYFSDAILDRLKIVNNIANYRGGGIYTWISSLVLKHITLSRNSADYLDGGIYFWDVPPIIINSIIFNNPPNSIGPLWSDLIIVYSNIDEEWNGEGNIYFIDPLFVNPDSENFTLQPNSPCIDAGTDYFDINGVALIDLSPSDYIGDAPDMGSSEFNGSVVSGDLNSDGILNILDVVILVNIVLGGIEPNGAGDLNGDGILNILDVVILVNNILEGE